ncbi:hypothetical protein KPH14_012626 [Odynerus spinipes]|uniref:Envelope protein n=1 Tax=Odynerus spinipes TaxID=1348599 RepID=A0AAD9REM6_9HYME|nr:hypothetical protein KPH14_012626 [Odynerus spinipes]
MNSRASQKLCRKEILKRIFATARSANPYLTGNIENSVEIRNFKHQPGIYLENVGTLHLYKETWKLVIQIDMTPYYLREESLASYCENLTHICHAHQPWHATICRPFINIITAKLRSITKKLNSIRATLGVEPRPKRGLINGLGTAGKYLFGLMDANDEERINVHLDKLERSETKIWHALSQQIQIVNSTIKIFNDSFGNIEQRERILATAVTRIEKMLNTQQRTYDLREQIDEQFMLITLMIDDLLEDVQDLTHYITDIRKGLINTNILSFAQILRYLQEALPHLPTGLNFPIPLNTQSGYLLDRVTEVKAYSRQRSIITAIIIPLIGTQIFQVKTVHPIPAHINNSTYAIIATSKHYAIVDEIRREYVSLSETDIQTCKATNTQFLCSSRHPIYKIYPHGPCEVRMHNKISKQPENYKTRLLTLDKTLLLELEAPETWIFVAPMEELLAVTCNGKRTLHKILQGSGILNIKGKCILSTSELTIETAQEFKETRELNYLPTYNLTFNLTPVILEKIIRNQVAEIDLQPIIRNPEELKLASTGLTKLRKEVDANLYNNNYHVFGYPPLVSTGIIILVLAALYTTYYRCKQRKHHIETNRSRRPQKHKKLAVPKINIALKRKPKRTESL